MRSTPSRQSVIVLTLALLSVVFVSVFVTAARATGPSPDPYPLSASQYAGMVYAKWGGGADGRCAVRIMYRESHGNPRAANYRDSNGGSYGLMQMNGAHRWRGESLAQFQQRMWNPVTHLTAAKRLFDASLRQYGYGWKPWRGC